MSATTTTMTSSASTYNGPALWEKVWLSNGIGFVLFVILAYFVYALPPPDTRGLIAVILSGTPATRSGW